MTFQMLLDHPLTHALGQALLHFLWQGTLLAALLLLLNTMAGRSSARLRYAGACAVMLLMPVVFIATVVHGYPFGEQASLAPRVDIAPVATGAGLNFEPARAESSGDLSGWAVCLWLAGVLALSAYTAGGWVRVQRIKQRASEPVHLAWIEALESLQRHFEISRPVRLCASALAEVPAVIGWLRPVILLPVTAITGLDESQLRAILAHELAHIRRHDYLVNLLQSGVETLLFYHPAVWWVGRQIRLEREHCCDDMAIAACGDLMLYASALTRLEELRGGIPEPALAASGGDLLARIRRLTNSRLSDAKTDRGWSVKSLGGIATALFVLCIAAVPMLRQLNAAPQNPPAPSTEAPKADVHKSEPPTAQSALGGGIGKGIGAGVGAGVGGGIPDAGIIRDLDRTITQVNAGLAQIGAGAPPVRRAGTGQGVDLLLKLYDGSKDIDVKQEVLSYLAESDNPKAADKVLSVARTEPNADLRRAAISYIAEKEKSFDSLVALYDGDTDVQVKQAILSYIAESDDPRVNDKLFSIAQSDPSPELRRAAVSYLAER